MKDISRIWCLILAMALTLAYTACSDDDTVDNDDFVLYYYGMTDIGPSMSGVISAPSYKGCIPSEFAITGITLNGESYNGSDFNINPETGIIEINSAKETPVGIYKISVACMAGGSYHEYKDAVTINMMKPIPDGITVDPQEIQVEYSVVADPNSKEALPTAQVKTNGNHVSITKYAIAKSGISSFFKISSTGKISIVRGSDITPGKHTLSLKLTTGAEEGIFENALTINVTSKPLNLTYEPDNGLIEAESDEELNTTFQSQIPALKGSLEGVSYAIESITPKTDKIMIDPATGVLSVKKHHGFKAGQKYVVSVRVANQFATEGVVFDNVFTLNVTNHIAPIAHFAYPTPTNVYEGGQINIVPNKELEGDGINFVLQDNLNQQLTINEKGVISAKKGNSIPVGNHTIKVIASNTKNTAEATVILNIKQNPNKFTYIRYGNNLQLDAATHANQYRIVVEKAANAASILSKFVIPAPTTDIQGKEVHWSIRNGQNCANVEIDKKGQIRFAKVIWPGMEKSEPAAINSFGFCFVTATVGGSNEPQYALEVPIFIHYDLATAGVHVQYNPFVFHVNPQKIDNNTYSAQPHITGVTDLKQFTLDYRRSFNYFPISGNFTKGDPKHSNFLNAIWTRHGTDSNKGINLGSRNAVSYYSNTERGTNTLSFAAAYVDPTHALALKLNPNKWVLDGEYPDGIFTGQMTFDKTGKDPQKGSQVFPLIIWFDPNF